jgi:hypothetical protein
MGKSSKKSPGKKLEMKNPMRDSARDSELGNYFNHKFTFEYGDNVIDIPDKKGKKSGKGGKGKKGKKGNKEAQVVPVIEGVFEYKGPQRTFSCTPKSPQEGDMIKGHMYLSPFQMRKEEYSNFGRCDRIFILICKLCIVIPLVSD